VTCTVDTPAVTSRVLECGVILDPGVPGFCDAIIGTRNKKPGNATNYVMVAGNLFGREKPKIVRGSMNYSFQLVNNKPDNQ
jgi:hypothetical protein